MSAPPIVLGAVIGGLTNKQDPLKGAVLGALGGGAIGAAGSAAATGAAAKTGATTAAGLKAAASPFASSTAASAAKSLAANPLQSLTAESLGALTAGGTMSPVASGLSSTALTGTTAAGASGLTQAALNNATLANKPLNFGSKLSNLVKDKPLETADLISSVTGGNEEQAQQLSPGLYNPAGSGTGFGNVPSVEQAIASVADSPRFIPRGLFEEGKKMLRDEEELLMLQQQLQARGLV